MPVGIARTGGSEISRRKPLPKNRGEPHIEQAVMEMVTEQPAYGQVRVASEITRRGTFISPTGVCSVRLRNDLHSFQRCLKALEAKMAQQPGGVPTESQVRALEKRGWKRGGRRDRDGTSRVPQRRIRTMRATSRVWAAFRGT